MQTQNLLETPRIQHYLPEGSENVLGAVNQQAEQPLANAMPTLYEEVGCSAPETYNGHLLREMVIKSGPPATEGMSRYKNSAISSKLREQSIAESKFMDFVRTEPGFGKKRGESITITRADILTQPTSATLSEHDRIPVDDFSLSTTAITVSEYGRAVTFTHMSQLLSRFDPQDPIQKALRKQMTKALDRLAATTMKTTYLIYAPTSLTGGTFMEDGTIDTAALVNVNIDHLGAIRDAFADTYVVDPYEGDDYIGLLSTKALRGIKSDENFETWKQYLREGDTLHNSEVGKVESIRCIEIKDTSCLANNKGTGSVLGEGIIFGDDFCAMIEAETPEVRVQVNFGQDHGRVNSAAWYGVEPNYLN